MRTHLKFWFEMSHEIFERRFCMALSLIEWRATSRTYYIVRESED